MKKTEWSIPQKVFLILAALSVFCIALFVILSLATATIVSIGQPSPTAKPPRTPKTPKVYTITYKVTRTTYLSAIDYSCFGYSNPSKPLGVEKVPWEETITCKPNAGYIILQAHHRKDDKGILTCEIWVDGELVSSDTQAYKEGASSAYCSWGP